MAWIIIESAPLNIDQMINNAQEYANAMIARGRSKESISADLGNIQSESSINPGRWESDNIGNLSGGFGLVQWTPATNYINWATANGYARTDPQGQIEWIANVTGPAGQWIPTSAYPMSWDEYKVSTNSPEDLASAFLRNFERPGDIPGTEPGRRSQARFWYDTLDWSGVG